MKRHVLRAILALSYSTSLGAQKVDWFCATTDVDEATRMVDICLDAGINIIDNSMQNPQTQQFNLGVDFASSWANTAGGVVGDGKRGIPCEPAGDFFHSFSSAGRPRSLTASMSVHQFS